MLPVFSFSLSAIVRIPHTFSSIPRNSYLNDYSERSLYHKMQLNFLSFIFRGGRVSYGPKNMVHAILISHLSNNKVTKVWCNLMIMHIFSKAVMAQIYRSKEACDLIAKYYKNLIPALCNIKKQKVFHRH